MKGYVTDKIDDLLTQLRDEISDLKGQESYHAARAESLESDLNAYKSLCIEYKADKENYQRLAENIKKEKDDLENTFKGHRVVALLDGDGVIFSTALVLQGGNGGQKAAQSLSEEILGYMKRNYGAKPYQLWIKIFLNKRGLLEAYKRFGNANEKDRVVEDKYNEFILGFNQAAERFLMVDVGTLKEAADAKIRAHLEDDLRIPQTEKVIFGGCHDAGYINSLKSHMIASGFREKLILLPGYSDVARGIEDLGLPTMPLLPNIFLSRKLGADSCSTPQSPRKARNAGIHGQDTSVSRSASPTSQMDMAMMPLGNRSAHGNNSIYLKFRVLDESLPLSKQKPPPCTRYYLAGLCKFNDRCIYGHDYDLNNQHLQDMRRMAKNSPCDTIFKEKDCSFVNCPFAHYCPSGEKCFFLKQRKCKFGGAERHAPRATEHDRMPQRYSIIAS